MAEPTRELTKHDPVNFFFTEAKPLSLKGIFDVVRNYFLCAALFGVSRWLDAGAPGLFSPGIEGKAGNAVFLQVLSWSFFLLAFFLTALNCLFVIGTSAEAIENINLGSAFASRVKNQRLRSAIEGIVDRLVLGLFILLLIAAVVLPTALIFSVYFQAPKPNG